MPDELPPTTLPTTSLTTPVPGPKEWWGARHTLALLGFLGFSTVYAMRVNLSVAIVAMVKSEAIANDTEPDADTCPYPEDWEGSSDAGNQVCGEIGKWIGGLKGWGRGQGRLKRLDLG